LGELIPLSSLQYHSTSCASCWKIFT